MSVFQTIHRMLGFGVFAVVFPLVACSGQISVGPRMSSEDLAGGVKLHMNEQTGFPPKSVTCDGPLNAKVGATQSCTLIWPDDTSIGLTTTATKVDGLDITYDIVIDTPEPNPSR